MSQLKLAKFLGVKKRETLVAEKSWIRTQPPAILLPSDPTVQLHLEKENNKGGKLALIVLPGWLKENCM